MAVNESKNEPRGPLTSTMRETISDVVFPLLLYSLCWRTSTVTPGGTDKGNRPIFDRFAAVDENNLNDNFKCCT